MTTSKLPWTTRHNLDNSATVLDASGREIGTFADWRDAEVCARITKAHSLLGVKGDDTVIAELRNATK